MAISYIGASASIAWSGAIGTDPVTPVYPASYTAVTDDVAVAIVGWRTGGAPSVPSGWAAAGSIIQAEGIGLAMFVKVLTASESLPTFSGYTGGAVAWVRIYRGVDPTTPQDVAAVTSSASGVGPWTPTGVTTVNANSMVISGSANFEGSNQPTLDTANGFSDTVAGGNANSGQGIQTATANKVQTVAGAVTMPAWGNSSWHAGVTVALREYNPPSAPDAPVVTYIKGWDAKIHLIWTAPNGYGNAVTDYTVESSPDGTTWTDRAVGLANTLTVTGLTNGVALQWRVSATNSIGTSAWSTIVSATPAAYTPAASVEPRWSYPNNNGRASRLQATKLTRQAAVASMVAALVFGEANGTVTGTAANTLGSFTSSASGSSVTGTSARTLGAFTSSAVGGTGPSGTAANTLAPFTSSASGSSVVGTSARTLDPFTSTASGATGPSGSIAVTLAPFTSSASGTFTPASVTGTIAVTLAPFTSAAAGSSVTGASATALGAFISSASGGSGPSGAIAATLGAFTSSASGSSVVGTSARTLDPFTSSAAGATGPSGAIAATLGAFTSSASGSSVTGSSSTTLGSFTSAASGTANPPGVSGNIAVTLGTFTSAASGTFTPIVTGTIATTLATFTSSASGSSVVGSSSTTLGGFTSAASGTVSPPGTSGTIAVTLGTFTSSASGSSVTGTSTTTLASFTSTANGTFTPPLVTGTIAETLGPFASGASGSVGVIGPVIIGVLRAIIVDETRTTLFDQPDRTTSFAEDARTTEFAR